MMSLIYKKSILNGIKSSNLSPSQTTSNSTSLVNLVNGFFPETSCRYCCHYTTLGIHKDATSKEIKKAYIQKCKQFHPDTLKSDANDSKKQEYDGKIKEITKAYSILGNESKRRKYDTEKQMEELKSENPHYRGGQYRYATPDDLRRYYGFQPQDPYYHDKMILSPAKIVLLCLLLMAIGSYIRLQAAWKAYLRDVERSNRTKKEYAEQLVELERSFRLKYKEQYTEDNILKKVNNPKYLADKLDEIDKQSEISPKIDKELVL